MLILAMDTSTVVSSVAVMDEARLLAEVTSGARLTHSETLQPHIEMAMKMAGASRSDIEAVAVGIGPGSFTGLRIGLAAAKAMAYALNVPLVGISTAEAMAANLPSPGVHIGALIDAQKKNAYFSIYRWENGEMIKEQSIRIVPISDAVKRCGELAERTDMPVMLVGDIASKKLMARDDLPANVTVAPVTHVMPCAASAARLGIKRLKRGESDNVMNLEPLYIRRSEAEELWDERHKEEKSK